MKDLAKIAAWGLLIELIAIVVFIRIAHSNLADPGKEIVEIVSYAAMAALSIYAVLRLSVRHLFLLAFFLALGCKIIEDILGYLFFPGLVKGIEFFSLLHLEHIVRGTVIYLAHSAGGLFSAFVLVKIAKTAQPLIKKDLTKITAWGLLIELVSLLAFIGVAQSSFADPGKDIAYVVFFAAIAALLFAAVMKLPVRQLFWLALFLALGCHLVQVILGFLFFPGLVKDLAFFSLDHLKATVLSTVLFFGIFAGGLLAAFVLVKAAKALKTSR